MTRRSSSQTSSLLIDGKMLLLLMLARAVSAVNKFTYVTQGVLPHEVDAKCREIGYRVAEFDSQDRVDDFMTHLAGEQLNCPRILKQWQSLNFVARIFLTRACSVKCSALQTKIGPIILRAFLRNNPIQKDIGIYDLKPHDPGHIGRGRICLLGSNHTKYPKISVFI